MQRRKKIDLISIVPSFREMMTIYIALLTKGTEEGKKTAAQSLMTLADELDKKFGKPVK